ncbi:hypothetical protein [Streptomyces sp. 5-10]|uniref:hypothetical protein n=1 Tax=Streptomyces sp. 5-10 TaxID=878925 RepID=UPI00168B7ABD|nr:hypothetical protein [Streptomyces sp. 5-10]MBD3004602.1 hypothetical protein [Streptomyces sp. 5-10]
MRKYILIKRDGRDNSTIEAVGETYASIVDAADAAGDDLIATHGLPWQRASKYSTALLAEGVGAIASTPDSSLNYRILEADFTSDRKPILPGLRVLNNDWDEGTVDPAQFMDGESGYPGGEHFDNWYYVRLDGEDRPRKRFNGERMRSIR